MCIRDRGLVAGPDSVELVAGSGAVHVYVAVGIDVADGHSIGVSPVAQDTPVSYTHLISLKERYTLAKRT